MAHDHMYTGTTGQTGEDSQSDKYLILAPREENAGPFGQRCNEPPRV